MSTPLRACRPQLTAAQGAGLSRGPFSPALGAPHDTDLPMPMVGMKMKATSLCGFMFARAMHQMPDMVEQHKLLNQVVRQTDAGPINKVIGRINAFSLREAHRLIETGVARGRIVLEGWGN